MPNILIDGDVYPDDYFYSCNESEKRELRDIVCEHFDIPVDMDIVDAIVTKYKVDSGLESKELIRRTLDELERKLRDRDFS